MNVVCPNCRQPMSFNIYQNSHDPENDSAFWQCPRCCLIKYDVQPDQVTVADILSLGAKQ